MATAEAQDVIGITRADLIKTFLKDNRLFHGFSEDQLDSVASLGRVVTFEAGDLIIEENEVNDRIYLLKEGEVGVYKWNEKIGQPIHMATLGPNEVIGDHILLDNIPRCASVRALKRTILFEFSITQLRQWVPEKSYISEFLEKLSFSKLSLLSFSGISLPSLSRFSNFSFAEIFNSKNKLKNESELNDKSSLDMKVVSNTKNEIQDSQIEVQYESPLYSIFIRNMAKGMSLHIRNANATLAEALRNELEHTRARVVMGSFIIAIIAMLFFYVLLLIYMQQHGKNLSTTSFITTPMIIGYSVIIFLYMRNMRKAGYPLKTFGLTLKNWKISIKESLLGTVAFIGLLTLTKLFLITIFSDFEHRSLFEGNVVDMKTDVHTQILLFFLYLMFVPLQEFVARGALQSSFEEFLISPRKKMLAIFLSNILFGMTHFIISIWFGLLSFIPGLMWGWLYSRHRTLVGVTISHQLVGIWGIYFLGI